MPQYKLQATELSIIIIFFNAKTSNCGTERMEVLGQVETEEKKREGAFVFFQLNKRLEQIRNPVRGGPFFPKINR